MPGPKAAPDRRLTLPTPAGPLECLRFQAEQTNAHSTGGVGIPAAVPLPSNEVLTNRAVGRGHTGRAGRSEASNDRRCRTVGRGCPAPAVYAFGLLPATTSIHPSPVIEHARVHQGGPLQPERWHPVGPDGRQLLAVFDATGVVVCWSDAGGDTKGPTGSLTVWGKRPAGTGRGTSTPISTSSFGSDSKTATGRFG